MPQKRGLNGWRLLDDNNDNDNDLLTDPPGGSSLLNYKINQIKLFTKYTVGERALKEIFFLNQVPQTVSFF